MRYTNLFVNSLRFNTILIKYAKHTFHFYGGFRLPLACIFLLSFSLPPRYHFDTTHLPSNTFPVLSNYFLYFSLFLLRKSKKCSNFATANQKFVDIVIKSVYLRLFWWAKSSKFLHTQNKKAVNAPGVFNPLCPTMISISAWAFIVYSCMLVLLEPCPENMQK